MNDENLQSLNDEDLFGAEDPAESTGDDGRQEGTDEEKTAEKTEQTPEERARQAEGRRLREREQQGYNAGYQKARAEMSETLRRLGIEDPDNGGTLDSVDALESYEKGLRDKRIASGRGTAQDMKEIVREAVREEQAKSQPPALSSEMQRQLAEIRAMDPEMKDLGAILSSDAGPKFREYVTRGLDFVDAYTLAARDRLATLTARRAGNAERAKAAGKDHLGATNTRGQGSLSVPADEMALFRELNPGATDDEIRRFYNADRKRFGG